ncbi:helix-turn-helix domain-containing protein [Halalkalibacter nanhaiisediminis]|uniref:Two component transcriptional regulator, AraC family n=1 Tax=Halalkalibacter nanhaiisediminis TaxID=688079 RepID=A0A562QJC2_9BACI|nr:helix-turn-helix domain-containing protein [Halalkalibacter nanhaiisediminis]TWI56146.1 two component transcriptional regulator, AraC family [Halalkalibacter nanhaiisediminis]
MAEILVVDDDIESRQTVRFVIGESQYNYLSITEVGTVDKGMLLLKQKRPLIVFMDLSLPDGDGLAFGKKVLEKHPHLPIVVLTHLKMFHIIQDCMNAGFSSYLLKPISKSELLTILARLMTKYSVRNEEQMIDRKESINRSFETDVANPIETAIKYIQLNYSKPISLKEVANLVYLSPSHFSRMFKEETGSNFVEYLMKYRVEKSKNLLKMSMLPVEVISSNNGFSSAAYFSTIFKRLEGVTPSEYRNLLSKLNHKEDRAKK